MTELNNIYMPFKAMIKDVIDIGGDVKLFRVIPPLTKDGARGFSDYLLGQFFMVSAWGAGEAPISITSTSGLQKHLEFGIRKVGAVTTALHKLRAGDKLWLRGPYGNGFKVDAAKKRDVVFIAGGIGIVPLRPLLNYMLINKKQYKNIFLLYGSKNPSEMLFKDEIELWGEKGTGVILTVDTKDKNWRGNEGLVTGHIDKIETDFGSACSYICGPEIMIANVMKELSGKGMPDSRIVTTLEARMKCGMGKCGQCYHGTEYVCTNGPVYTYEEIKKRQVYGP